MTTERVPNVLGEVIRTRAFLDVSTVTIHQALLELAAGQTDGPALSRIRQHHEDLADDMGILQ